MYRRIIIEEPVTFVNKLSVMARCSAWNLECVEMILCIMQMKMHELERLSVSVYRLMAWNCWTDSTTESLQLARCTWLPLISYLSTRKGREKHGWAQVL